MKVLYSADLREYSNEELMCTLSERAAEEANPNISFDDFVRSLSPAKKKICSICYRTLQERRSEQEGGNDYHGK